MVDEVKETWFHISQFTLRCSIQALLLQNKPLHFGLQVKIIPSLTDTLTTVSFLSRQGVDPYKAGLCKGNSAKTFSHLFVAIFSHGPSTD